MNLILVIFSVVITISRASPWSIRINEELNDLWDLYKIKFGKNYEVNIESIRRKIWEENMKFIQIHNFEYNLGKHKYFLGVNEFADLTHEEFKSIYLQYRPIVRHVHSIKSANYSIKKKLPDTVNWVKKGYVTQVKNQGQCGSCWSFSTTGSMEGQYFKKNKRLVSFSEQQLVDCSNDFGNQGCNGGLMDRAFQYIMQYGLEKESDYPYTAQDGECKYSKEKVVAHCIGFTDISQGSEEDLAEKLATVGPISVGIDASNPSFQFYNGGVYDEENCSSTQLDHGVLAVGYGNDEDSEQNYWLVKNSWGKSWGINGYIKMSKDKDNQCGIATMASYPNM